MPPHSEPILVTGAFGFIGTHLVETLLEQGWAVRAVVRRRPAELPSWLDRVELLQGDLRDPRLRDRAVQGVAAVCHLAGVTSAPRAADFERGNAEITAALARAAARADVARFLYTSSLAAVGPSNDGRPRSEDMPLSPISVYGRSKAMGEVAVQMVMPAQRWTIVRPPVVYGPADRALLQIVRWVARGVLPVARWGPRRISLIHVSDATRGMATALIHPAAVGGTFFLAHKDPVSVPQLYAYIAAALECHQPIAVAVPRPIVRLGALLGTLWGRCTGHTPMLNHLRVSELSAREWTCGGERAGAVLGFRCRIPHDEGISDTVRWYVEHRWLRRCRPQRSI